MYGTSRLLTYTHANMYASAHTQMHTLTYAKHSPLEGAGEGSTQHTPLENQSSFRLTGALKGQIGLLRELSSSERQKRSHDRVQGGMADEMMRLEESQLVLFCFPERNLLVSCGINGGSLAAEACRAALMNRRSAVISDSSAAQLALGASSSGSLAIVMLDGLMDQVFPILDVYGDALEGLTCLCTQQPTHEHVRLSHKIKFQVTQVPLHWDT